MCVCVLCTLKKKCVFVYATLDGVSQAAYILLLYIRFAQYYITHSSNGSTILVYFPYFTGYFFLLILSLSLSLLHLQE